MAKVYKTKNSNFLIILAISVLLLSFGITNLPKFLSSVNTQSVLSDSDEKEEVKDEEKKEEDEEKKEVDNNKAEEKKEESKKDKVETKSVTVSPKTKVEAKKEVKEIEKDDDSNDDKDDDVDDDKDDDKDDDVNDDKDDDKDDDETESESEFEAETETVSANGVVTKFKLKTKMKVVNGKTIVETKSGEVEVEKDPEDSVNDLIDLGIIDTPINFEIKSEGDKVEYKFEGTDAQKLFGIFDLNLKKEIIVDADS